MFSVGRLCRALLPLTVVVPLLVFGGSAAYADYDLAVTWPTATRVNPSLAPYSIQISDPGGPGNLQAIWNGDAQTGLSHDGSATLDLPTDGVGVVQIYRCIDGQGCAPTGVESPQLSVYRHLLFDGFDTWGPGAPGVVSNVSLHLTPNPDGTPVDVMWTIRSGPAADAPVIATGGSTLVPNAGGSVSVPIAVPAVAPEGTAWLEVTGATTLPDFGALTGTTGASQFVINTPPVFGLTLSALSFYPVVDGYQDALNVHYSTNEDVEASVEVINAGGDRVRTLASALTMLAGGYDVTWDGRDDLGDLVPAGTYNIRFRGGDGQHTITVTKTVVVHNEHLEMVTNTTILTAKQSLWGKFVGKCSTLASPSSHRWAGSFGYYSQTKCKKAKQSAVVTSQAWWIPKAINNKYGSLQVSTYGGKAVKARYAYLVAGYLRASDNAFKGRAQFSGSLGWHRGTSVPVAPYVRYQDGFPFVVWTAGLTSGARYDVKTFEVKVTYQALVSPAGRVVGRSLPRAAPTAPASFARPSTDATQ